MGGSADMYGGKKRRSPLKTAGYKERMPLSMAESDKPVLGGRKKTRRLKYRYIRGMKLRVPTRKQSTRHRK
jgi:hypothetical protein